MTTFLGHMVTVEEAASEKLRRAAHFLRVANGLPAAEGRRAEFLRSVALQEGREAGRMAMREDGLPWCPIVRISA